MYGTGTLILNGKGCTNGNRREEIAEFYLQLSFCFFFIYYTYWKKSLNNVTEIWISVTKSKQSVSLRAGTRGNHLHHYRDLRAWETTDACSRKEAHTKFWDANTSHHTHDHIQLVLSMKTTATWRESPYCDRLEVKGPTVFIKNTFLRLIT